MDRDDPRVRPPACASYLPWLIAAEVIIGCLLTVLPGLGEAGLAVAARKRVAVLLPVYWLVIPLTLGLFWDSLPIRSRWAWKVFTVMLLAPAGTRAARAVLAGAASTTSLGLPLLEIAAILGCFFLARFVRRLGRSSTVGRLPLQ